MKNHNAFSLLELIITIAIISLFCLITLPGLGIANKKTLSNELDTLIYTIKYIRQKAIAGNKKYELFFDEQNNKYWVNLNKKKQLLHNLPGKIMFGILPNTKGPPSKQKTPTKKAITFSEKKISFYPNGKISPGTIYMKTKDNHYMGAITCPISQVSYVRKYI